jgi:hypothetical protein
MNHLLSLEMRPMNHLLLLEMRPMNHLLLLEMWPQNHLLLLLEMRPMHSGLKGLRRRVRNLRRWRGSCSAQQLEALQRGWRGSRSAQLEAFQRGWRESCSTSRPPLRAVDLRRERARKWKALNRLERAAADAAARVLAQARSLQLASVQPVAKGTDHASSAALRLDVALVDVQVSVPALLLVHAQVVQEAEVMAPGML